MPANDIVKWMGNRSRIRDFVFFAPTAVLSLLLFFPMESFGELAHLEIGAANYSGAIQTNIDGRFRVLFETVDDLIKSYGREGVIYLNDIDASGLQLAASSLRERLERQGITGISVVELGTNLFEQPNAAPVVKTAQMAHPDASMLAKQEAIAKISRRAKDGLRIISFDSNISSAFRDQISDGQVIDEATHMVYRDPTGAELPGAKSFAFRIRMNHPDLNDRCISEMLRGLLEPPRVR